MVLASVGPSLGEKLRIPYVKQFIIATTGAGFNSFFQTIDVLPSVNEGEDVNFCEPYSHL